MDIYFLVLQIGGYRQLRRALTTGKGLAAITRRGQSLTLSRELRADQYGLRTMLRVADVDIRFEIVLESRIQLDPPGAADSICDVATLTLLDMPSSKLLANSHRWADTAVLSRDLIDLAMMSPPKASTAHGQSISEDLNKAIAALRARPHRLGACMQAMGITALPKALLWQGIKALGKGL